MKIVVLAGGISTERDVSLSSGTGIYKALKNFVHSYQSGLNEVMAEAVAVCADGFKTYWGQTLVNTLRAVHSVNNQANPEDDAVSSNYSEDLLW